MINLLFQTNMIAAIELLSLLRASGASLNLYEKIVFWVEKRFLNVNFQCKIR